MKGITQFVSAPVGDIHSHDGPTDAQYKAYIDTEYSAYSEKANFACPESLPNPVQHELEDFWLACLCDEKQAVRIFINRLEEVFHQSAIDEKMDQEIERARATCTEMVSSSIKSQIHATIVFIRELPEHQRGPAAHYSAGCAWQVQRCLKEEMETAVAAAFDSGRERWLSIINTVRSAWMAKLSCSPF